MDIAREPNLDLLTAKDFSPEKYVKELSHNYVGGLELKNLRKKIQSLSEETSGNLKRNVYHNYVQFIDAAKEISHLESEMYQLSHLLSEQKSLLTALSSTSILEDRTHVNIERDNRLDRNELEEENKQKMTVIFENVEGCKEILDVPARTYLFEGDLLEIDPTENTALKFVHVYLFNDGLMVTTRNTRGRGLMKFAFESFYELASLAVVNVRDLGNVKHAFKLLIFPDTRVFQCSSNSSKKEWLDKIDQVKKARLASDQQKRESSIEKSPSRSMISVGSPLANSTTMEPAETAITTHPDWFLNVVDELDVCIAQRHFEEAVNLLEKATRYVQTLPQADHASEVQRKADVKRNHLIEVLMKELEVNPNKSLQGGLRAARRAVRLLNQLGRSAQSCALFLKLCSSILKIQCKRVRRESSTTTYVRHLSSVVFTNMCHMSEEFARAFSDSPSCTSSYVVWSSQEVSVFISHFIKQAFMPQTSLSTIADCVVLVREQCERLWAYGMDFRYQLDGALRAPLAKSLRDARDKLIDSVKLRAIEDKWIPLNLVTKSALARCLHEYEQFGLRLDAYVTGDVWLQLASSNLAFTKTFVALLNDCLKLRTCELLHSIDDTLYRVYDAQVKHNEQALCNELQPEQRRFILKNVSFLLGPLLDLAQSRYKKAVGYECASLGKLRDEYSALLRGVVPAPRAVTKTAYSAEFV
ncbi:exocyst complex component 8 [Cylas formicarius]|uniref:exocyst complex component 8 n=1 Tax=Cylas formicarius TaxID=197179 RepID=UPI002958386A|nr:exocyst complex component 8 [Cylas formicarius]